MPRDKPPLHVVPATNGLTNHLDSFLVATELTAEERAILDAPRITTLDDVGSLLQAADRQEQKGGRWALTAAIAKGKLLARAVELDIDLAGPRLLAYGEEHGVGRTYTYGLMQLAGFGDTALAECDERGVYDHWTALLTEHRKRRRAAAANVPDKPKTKEPPKAKAKTAKVAKTTAKTEQPSDKAKAKIDDLTRRLEAMAKQRDHWQEMATLAPTEYESKIHDTATRDDVEDFIARKFDDATVRKITRRLTEMIDGKCWQPKTPEPEAVSDEVGDGAAEQPPWGSPRQAKPEAKPAETTNFGKPDASAHEIANLRDKVRRLETQLARYQESAVSDANPLGLSVTELQDEMRAAWARMKKAEQRCEELERDRDEWRNHVNATVRQEYQTRLAVATAERDAAIAARDELFVRVRAAGRQVESLMHGNDAEPAPTAY